MKVLLKEKINIFVIIYFITLLTVGFYRLLDFRFISIVAKVYFLITYTVLSIIGTHGIYSVDDTKTRNYILMTLPIYNIFLLDFWVQGVMLFLVSIVFTNKLNASKLLKVFLRMIYGLNTLIVIASLLFSPILLFGYFMAKDTVYINTYSPDSRYLIRGYYSDLGATGSRYETYIDLEKVYFGIVTKREKRLYKGEPYDEPKVEWISNQTIKIGNKMMYINK